MSAFLSHADSSFYEAAAQIIPVLLLAAAVGESRLKVRNEIDARLAGAVVFLVAVTICVGEIAALRVLVVGHDSRGIFDLTIFSLGIGLGFVVQYLTLAAYRDVAGPDAEPTEAVGWMVMLGSVLISIGTLLFLAA
jgi:hypothetical protein